jgi:DeoR/GlpR family transcriptional regulator of sugar metabolism
MLPAQRLLSVLEDIRSNGVRSVNDLSRKYDVSEMTIRRDLKQLEEQGLITRTHGGAIPNRLVSEELQFLQKRTVHQAEKVQIARYAAANFVADNDIIILEGGTTVAGMVPYLTDYRNLTLMTHGLHTLFELQRITSGNTVISTGGILRDVSTTLVGPVAEIHFREFNAQKVFLSATGWTANSGFTDPNMLEIQVKKAMIQSAIEIIMLLDSSKFGVVSLTSFLSAFAIDVLITDRNIPDDIYTQFAEHRIDVHIANLTTGS